MPSTTGTLGLGDVEGLAHGVHHARHAVRGDVMRPGRVTRGAWSMPGCRTGVESALAGEHHHRQAGATAAGSAVITGHAGAHVTEATRLAGCHVVGRRRRYCDVLVPDVDVCTPGSFGEGGAPCMLPSPIRTNCVSIPPQERFCEGFVEFGMGKDYLDDR